MVSQAVKKRRSAMNRRKRANRSKASKALVLAKQNKLMINKTIENKQVSALRPPIFVTSSGYDAQVVGDTIQPTMRQGTEDGDQTVGSSARIGNSITLMRTAIDFNFDVAAYKRSL